MDLVGARCFSFLKLRRSVFIVLSSSRFSLANGDGYYVSVAIHQLAVIFASTQRGDTAYMIVHGLKDFLGRNQQRCHFPNGHLEVHLWELE